MLPSVSAFQLKGSAVSCERYGSGHINESYLVETTTEDAYILQKINQNVFRNIPALMQNISLVTRHLSQKTQDPRRGLTLIPTLEGTDYYIDSAGDCWRMYDFITDSLCLQKAESADDFYQSAVAFGSFQNLLADFPAETLEETIPHFHDTPSRYAALHRAINADAMGRVPNAAAEIAFAQAREAESSTMMEMLARGELPLRVTHNDTKLNNVVLDVQTRQPLCVLDLDTVMPGLVANDFGDSIRFGASTAAEDEQDLSKVCFSFDLYKAYVDGFLSACGSRLTSAELRTLPLGAKLMTLECGVRFLTDFLSGDTYFHTTRAAQNLDRCRTQFKLVADMEQQWTEMNDYITQAHARLSQSQAGQE